MISSLWKCYHLVTSTIFCNKERICRSYHSTTNPLVTITFWQTQKCHSKRPKDLFPQKQNRALKSLCKDGYRINRNQDSPYICDKPNSLSPIDGCGAMRNITEMCSGLQDQIHSTLNQVNQRPQQDQIHLKVNLVNQRSPQDQIHNRLSPVQQKRP